MLLWWMFWINTHGYYSTESYHVSCLLCYEDKIADPGISAGEKTLYVQEFSHTLFQHSMYSLEALHHKLLIMGEGSLSCPLKLLRITIAIIHYVRG